MMRDPGALPFIASPVVPFAEGVSRLVLYVVIVVVGLLVLVVLADRGGR